MAIFCILGRVIFPAPKPAGKKTILAADIFVLPFLGCSVPRSVSAMQQASTGAGEGLGVYDTINIIRNSQNPILREQHIFFHRPR